MLGLQRVQFKHGHACGVKVCICSGTDAHRTDAHRTDETQPPMALCTAPIQITSLTAIHCTCVVSTVLQLRHDTDLQAKYHAFIGLDFSFLCAEPKLHRASLTLLQSAI